MLPAEKEKRIWIFKGRVIVRLQAGFGVVGEDFPDYYGTLEAAQEDIVKRLSAPKSEFTLADVALLHEMRISL